MSEWQERSLAEVLSVAHGYAFKGKDFGQGGSQRLVTPGNFYERGGFRDRGQSQKSYEGPVPSEFVLPTGSLVIAMTEQAPGLLGSSGLIPNDRNTWLHNQRIGLVRVRDGAADERFLYYLFNGPSVRSQIEATATGTKVRHTAPGRIQAVQVRMPDVCAQRRIAAVLSAFDEIIEINERRIALLEGLARSLYREWFVHFRFPGHEGVEFVDSDLGPIPKGWAVRPLFEVSTVGFGFPFGSAHFAESGPFPVIRIRDVPRGVTTTFTDEEPQNHHLVREGDVLVGMDGEFYVREWSGGDAWLNQRVARLRPSAGLSSRHLMLAVMGPIRAWNESISGTTVAHLGKRHLEAIRVVLPEERILNEAGAYFDHVAGSHLALIKKNRALATTRDLLLPRLVTGRLDISDVDLGDLLPADAA